MARANASVTLPVPADQVWSLIGGFGSLPDWLPYIPTSELAEGGRVRHLANPDGAPIVERLVAFDQSARLYRYAILDAPFPVKDYVSTLQVVDLGSGKGSRVDWSGEFTPTGVSDDVAKALFQGIYEDGLEALARQIEQEGMTS